MKTTVALVLAFAAACCSAVAGSPFPAPPLPESAAPDPAAAESTARPHILFAIADDWGWPHASAYGDPAVKTPAFDRVAREGALFHHAYVSAPSCTPSRGAILTGQWHWRLGGAANLWSVFPDAHRTYPDLLQDAGYCVGSTGKGWGPGRTESAGREPAGKRYRGFREFLRERPKDRPFCFWLGSADPHRPYDAGSGAVAGILLDRIRLPAWFPDDPVVRSDVADYLFEVQRFDALVGSAIDALEREGELDRTLVVVSSDNGMPFPRAKSNLYDAGVRVPLAIRWPEKVTPGRSVDDLVSLSDLAPTFLEVAGLAPRPDMTARSLVPVLASPASGLVDPTRDSVLFGKERHVPGQELPDLGGYPSRAIRTHDLLYIRNFRPDRWPSGTPLDGRAVLRGWYADCDNGPTKSRMIEDREKDDLHRKLYRLAFAKRPSEELYDLKADPDQMANVADDPAYAEAKRDLYAGLMERLLATGDPRVLGEGDRLEAFPYLGSAPTFPAGGRKD